MNKPLLTRLAVIALVAIFGYFQKDKVLGPSQPVVEASRPVATQPQGLPKLKEDLQFVNTPLPTTVTKSNLVMKNLQIRDVDGSIAYQGDIDLNPVLNRIKAGKRDSHANDGAVFGNRERRLPQKESGYYKEYVVRTPGVSHAGPQRVVIGKQGEIYYTSDHYNSFKRIQP
jgi:ribonuclease T1